VWKNQHTGAQTLISAVFWEPFCAATAIETLLRSGFDDSDILALGILGGRAPDLFEFLSSTGLPSIEAAYYNDCFRDGAVLLLVYLEVPGSERIALDVIRHYGGLQPPADEIPTALLQ